MEESFRHKFKEYFYFLKKDRNGIIILILLILLTIGGHFIIEEIEVNPHADITDMIKVFEAWEDEQKLKDESLKFFYFDPNTVPLEQFDSLPIPQYIKNNIVKYRSSGGSFQRPADLKKIYGMSDSIYLLMEPWLRFPDQAPHEVEKNVKSLPLPVNKKFDPNTSTAEEMLLLGFNQFQVSNIEKYRMKGGRFYKSEDLLKIYGVDTNFYRAICENIQVEVSKSPAIDETPNVNLEVELNAADSLTLIRLNGIGPVFASRIIKYRNLLGGFYSADQLLEVYGFPEKTFYELKEHFVVDTLSIKEVRINFAEYVELIRHPYIEKEHVEAVLGFRDKHGPFLTKEQLLTEGLIDSFTYKRVKPYITCR